MHHSYSPISHKIIIQEQFSTSKNQDLVQRVELFTIYTQRQQSRLFFTLLYTTHTGEMSERRGEKSRATPKWGNGIKQYSPFCACNYELGNGVRRARVEMHPPRRREENRAFLSPLSYSLALKLVLCPVAAGEIYMQRNNVCALDLSISGPGLQSYTEQRFFISRADLMSPRGCLGFIRILFVNTRRPRLMYIWGCCLLVYTRENKTCVYYSRCRGNTRGDIKAVGRHISVN